MARSLWLHPIAYASRSCTRSRMEPLHRKLCPKSNLQLSLTCFWYFYRCFLLQGQLGSVSPSGTGNDHTNYRNMQQNEAGSQSQGSVSGLNTASSVPLGGFFALPSESVFPERPGQPECQFYMKTGDCKFGTVCKFHHPRDRQAPPPDCLLSPIGLPLRPVSCFQQTLEKKRILNYIRTRF